MHQSQGVTTNLKQAVALSAERQRQKMKTQARAKTRLASNEFGRNVVADTYSSLIRRLCEHLAFKSRRGCRSDFGQEVGSVDLQLVAVVFFLGGCGELAASLLHPTARSHHAQASQKT